jgi:hypothetical protein
MKKRRTEMNEEASTLGIDYTQFRNKTVLQAEIDRVSSSTTTPKPVCYYYYNTTDPCTLEDVQTIDPKYKIEWTQYGYRFCADVRSIKRMFDTGYTILPWSIDFCSGVRATQDPDEYERTFDMRYVPELVSKIEAFSFSSPEESPPEPEESSEHTNLPVTPFHAHFIRGIEDLVGDSYVYGALINRLLTAKKALIYRRVCGSMLKVLYHMQPSAAAADREDNDNNNMVRDVFYNYCYVKYSVTSFHISKREDHLAYLLDILQTFHQLVGEPAQFIIQMVMTEL